MPNVSLCGGTTSFCGNHQKSRPLMWKLRVCSVHQTPSKLETVKTASCHSTTTAYIKTESTTDNGICSSLIEICDVYSRDRFLNWGLMWGSRAWRYHQQAESQATRQYQLRRINQSAQHKICQVSGFVEQILWKPSLMCGKPLFHGTGPDPPYLFSMLTTYSVCMQSTLLT